MTGLWLLINFPTFKRAHICKVFTYLYRSFVSIIPQVGLYLMKLVQIIMDNIYDADVMNDVPSHEAMELLLISHLFNHGLAHHQNQGKVHGDTFITWFKDDISYMFECR